MRKYLIPVAAAGLALTSSMAMASSSTGGVGTEAQTAGIVTSWNAQTDMLTLKDEGTFQLPSAFSKVNYKPGDQVHIDYQMLANGSRINYVTDTTAKM